MKNIRLNSSAILQFDISSPSGEIRKGITVNPFDDIELTGSKGTANYVMKWANNTSQAYIKIVPSKKVDGFYNLDDSGSMKSIVGLECRGLDLVNWLPGADFSGESVGGTYFDSIDLTDKEWTEYDENADLALSILNLEYQIDRE